MSTARAIKSGFRLATRAGSAIWVIFFANLVLAALAAWPIYHGMLALTGHSLMSDTLANGFSVDWLADFSFNRPGALSRYAAVIAAFGLASIVMNALLAGGVLARFREPNTGRSLRDFFRDCARYAWPLIRLMFIGLVCYWLVFRVLNQALGHLADKWTRDWLNDRVVFWVKLVVAILVLLGLGFVNLVMDYARVRLIMEDDASAAEAFLASLGFTLGRLRRTIAIYTVPSLCGIALVGLYLLLTAAIHSLGLPAGHGRILEPLMVALLFIGQQAVMVGRYWFRVATWGSQWAYLRDWKLETE